MNSKLMVSAAHSGSKSEPFLVADDRTDSTPGRSCQSSLCAASLTLARSLIACGVGKDSRIGIVMTVRPERDLARRAVSAIGAAMIMHDTVSSPRELAAFLNQSACSVLLTERQTNGANIVTLLSELDTEFADSRAGDLQSLQFPFLRHIAVVDATDSLGAIESWDDFQHRSEFVWPELVHAIVAKPAA